VAQAHAQAAARAIVLNNNNAACQHLWLRSPSQRPLSVRISRVIINNNNNNNNKAAATRKHSSKGKSRHSGGGGRGRG
jgi:hypothetical protein